MEKFLENLIEIKNLVVEYKISDIFNRNKSVHAINGLSLDIKKGEIFAIAGESGCGKSTLAKALLKLTDIKSGTIVLNVGDKKLNIADLNKSEMKHFRESAQMIFQNPYSSLDPKMKIYDILKEPLIINKDIILENGKKIKDLSRAEIDDIIRDTIRKVGLEENVLALYPHEFSGGQRQRIAIARALILSPKFIVADEPVSALDVSIQAQIINLLKDLQEQFNLTFLFISHDLSVIRYISDSVAIMYLGEIVETGTSEEVFSEPKHPYTQALLSAAPSEKKGGRIILKGDLPSPTDLPSGCKFHTRCPYAMPICKKQKPNVTVLSATHRANCFLLSNVNG